MTTEEWVNHIFNAWNDNGISFVVMRGYEELPSYINNDLDILFNACSCKRAEEILVQTVRHHGGHIHNRVAFGALCLYFYDPETLVQYHFDFYERLEWRGFDFLPAEELFRQAQTVDNYFIPSPLHEVILCLLTRLLYGGYVNRKYTDRVMQFAEDEPESVQNVLTACFGPKLARALMEAILLERWDGVDAMANRFRWSLMVRQAAKRPIVSIQSVLTDFIRLIKRWFLLPGLVISIRADNEALNLVHFASEVSQGLHRSFYPQISMIVVDHTNGGLLKDNSGTGPLAAKIPDSLVRRVAFWWRVRMRLFQNALIIICVRNTRCRSKIESLLLKPSLRNEISFEYGNSQTPSVLVEQILAHQSRRVSGTAL